MATIRWQGNVNNTWDAAGNWIGGLPAHGDDVQFLGADLGANRCAVGPTAVVLLNSILADAAYGAVATDVCYDNCGMDGRPLATVTIEGASIMNGGWATLVTLDGVGAYMLDGTVTTIYLNGAGSYMRGGTAETVYCENANSAIRTDAPANNATVTTVYLNGLGAYVREDGGGAVVIGTAYLNGAASYVRGGATYTTVYMNGNAAQMRDANPVGTLYVYGAACEVSLVNTIATGSITSGPHMCGLDQILYDYTSGLVIGDLTQIPSYSAGAW